jgi:hypothetical protein
MAIKAWIKLGDQDLFAYELSKDRKINWLENCEVFQTFYQTDLLMEKIQVTDFFSNADKKILLTCFDEVNRNDFSEFDLIILSFFECLPPFSYQEICNIYKNDNIILLLNGYDTNANIPDERVFPFTFTCFSKVVFANENYSFDSQENRPYLFDALMGNIRINREFVFEKLSHNGLLEKSLVNIHPSDHYLKNYDYRSPFLDLYDIDINIDCKNAEQIARAANTRNNWYNTRVFPHRPLDDYKSKIWVCDVIPEKIYQNSWYTIVTETGVPESCRFITEKTAKPLYAKHLFVLFGVPETLKILREHSYQTFENVIDESYDLIPDISTRYNAAWKQIEFLSKQDPLTINKKIQPILDHNHNQIKSNVENINQNIKKFIQRWINSL